MYRPLLIHGRVILAAVSLQVVLLAHVQVRGQESHRGDAPSRKLPRRPPYWPPLPLGKKR